MLGLRRLRSRHGSLCRLSLQGGGVGGRWRGCGLGCQFYFWRRMEGRECLQEICSKNRRITVELSRMSIPMSKSGLSSTGSMIETQRSW